MAVIACLVAFLAVVPFMPSCLAVPGRWDSERVVKGRMTPEYQEELKYAFDRF
jgi:hypothetical protein